MGAGGIVDFLLLWTSGIGPEPVDPGADLSGKKMCGSEPCHSFHTRETTAGRSALMANW